MLLDTLERTLTEKQSVTLFLLARIWGLHPIAVLATLAAPTLEDFAEDLQATDSLCDRSNAAHV
jgi:hypothetical protein